MTQQRSLDLRLIDLRLLELRPLALRLLELRSLALRYLNCVRLDSVRSRARVLASSPCGCLRACVLEQRSMRSMTHA
jgi:hypothetical protein